MGKKDEFMGFIKEMLDYDTPSKTMIKFLVETIDICLTEERVVSKEFLTSMIKLTEKYISLTDK